jgi:hypothetical protein
MARVTTALFAQYLEDCHVQWVAVPLIRLAEIHGQLLGFPLTKETHESPSLNFALCTVAWIVVGSEEEEKLKKLLLAAPFLPERI